ncbi:MAG: VOC family protein [Saprospiraceae bacterium]
MIWANLASADLKRTASFYTALGFESNGQSEELTSFFFGKEKFIIHFFVKTRFESAVNSKAANLDHQNEVIFSISAKSKEEVDQWHEKVKNAGGNIFSAPQKYEQGYTFGFSDPDGHKFNFLYWPGM